MTVKTKTKEQAIVALMRRAARAEICIEDAKRSLYRWRVAPEDHPVIIERLLKEKFIDETRYADAFVRDKMNVSKWGKRKIADALFCKKIPAPIIENALRQIAEDEEEIKLAKALTRKRQTLTKDGPQKQREKLIRLGISRGFEPEKVIEIVGRLMRNNG